MDREQSWHSNSRHSGRAPRAPGQWEGPYRAVTVAKVILVPPRLWLCCEREAWVSAVALRYEISSCSLLCLSAMGFLL